MQDAHAAAEAHALVEGIRVSAPRSRRPGKPTKPHPPFPLTAHNNGQWYRSIRGRVHFLGVWEDSQAAMDPCPAVAADLHAGLRPRPFTLVGGLMTVKHLRDPADPLTR